MKDELDKQRDGISKVQDLNRNLRVTIDKLNSDYKMLENKVSVVQSNF